MDRLLEICRIVGVSVANASPFMIKGKSKGTEDFVSGEWGIELGELYRACDWRGEVCFGDVECGEERVQNSWRDCVLGTLQRVIFGDAVFVSLVKPDKFGCEGLGWWLKTMGGGFSSMVLLPKPLESR
ncbi:hypothetical protein M758_11G122800 [Ceratodon purpureus]|nr:hypothetical protein M758_11G122800 [Ceratodon purpureus]